MKNRLICGLIAAVISAAFLPFAENPVSAEEAPYVVKVYNEQNGLPTGEANTVLQTSDGYIWIGSYGGLIRYDGTNFRNYSVEGAITSSSVRSLFEDSVGRLWIGTNDSGVLMMENDIFTEIESPDNSFLCIRDFAEDKDGTIYVSSNSGIAEISGKELVPYVAEEMAGVTVYTLAIDSRDRLWGSTNNGECVVFKDGELIDIFTADRVFGETDIYSVEADKDGNIIIGTGETRMAVLNFNSDSLERSGFTAKYFDTGSVNTHNRISSFETGHIFVSGINGLAVIFPDGRVREFGEEQKAMSVNAAIADYENNIWLASSAYGIIKYSQGCFTTPNKAAQLEGIAVNANVKNGRFHYFGHDTGLIICDSDYNRIENELTAMFEGERIRCITADSTGNVWIAGYSKNTVVCYNHETGKITVFNEENGLMGSKARVVAVLSGGRVAVGTQTGVSIIENGVVTETYSYEDGMENPSVLCIIEGSEGEILVGSDGNGIYEIRDGKITNHGFDEGLEEGVVLRMIRTDKEFFISAGSSLYCHREGGFKRLTNFTKGAGSIFDLYSTDDGQLWLLQNNGIISLDTEKLLSGAATDTVTYGLNHGMSGSINANTWHFIDENGNLNISTRNGISVFGFSGVENDLPKVTISSVSVDDKLYEHPDTINITNSAQRVTINYSALSFADASDLRVAYQLKGFDRKAIHTSEKSGSVSYTNLRGGKYNFLISVYNSDSPEECRTYTLTINKEKAFVEKPLFWFLIAVLFILLSCGVMMIVTRIKFSTMRRRHNEYRSIIEQSLRTFAKTIDAKDPYTNGHSIRVAMYSRELAKRVGLSDEEQENIYYIALLHDIGKIGVPDHILNKPGKLTEEEREIIQHHVDTGGEILKDFTALDGITNGARYHHERYDGKGYSKGLSGTDIPKVARIIAVADTYDAMSSDRCYRKALSTEVIISEFNNNIGTQFDPEIVPHILDMIDEGVVPMEIE